MEELSHLNIWIHPGCYMALLTFSAMTWPADRCRSLAHPLHCWPAPQAERPWTTPCRPCQHVPNTLSGVILCFSDGPAPGSTHAPPGMPLCLVSACIRLHQQARCRAELIFASFVTRLCLCRAGILSIFCHGLTDAFHPGSWGHHPYSSVIKRCTAQGLIICSSAAKHGSDV